MKTISRGPFRGINNKLPSYALRSEDGDWLSDAVNVDVLNSGNIARRSSEVLIHELTDAHSLFESQSGNFYLVRDGVLYKVTLPSYTETAVKTLTSNESMSYVDYAGLVFYSNGTDSGKIAGSTNYPIGIDTPPAPTVTSIAGSLPSATYRVCITHINNITGEESGAGEDTNYTLGAEGGLSISMPPTAEGATHYGVYVTTPNGSVPMLAGLVAYGTNTATVTLLSQLGVGNEVSNVVEYPIPPGRLFLHNGTLGSYSGGNVFKGDAYRPGYHQPRSSRIPFPANVSNVVSAQNGLYVVADKTYWLLGKDLSEVQDAAMVLPYGGVKGTEWTHPKLPIVGWFGDAGTVIASTAGEVSTPMKDSVFQTPPSSGMSFVKTGSEIDLVVSCGWATNLTNMATTRYEDYSFTSASGSYGTKPDGIYALTGGAGVDSSIALGKDNFGSEEKKHVLAIYLGVDSDYKMEAQVTAEQGTFVYQARSSGGGMTMHRIDPGKGLRSSYYDVTIKNTNGADFNLASISFSVPKSNRRV